MELKIEQALKQAVDAHKKGKLQEAERLYRVILQSQPAHPDANHNLGVLVVSVNNAETALPLFKTALESNPKVEQFWLSYIDALIRENQIDTAKQVIQKAKNQEVNEERLYALEAQLSTLTPKTNTNSAGPSTTQVSSLLEYFQTRRYGDAEKLAASLTQEFPTFQFGWKVLGAVLSLTDRKSEAVNANNKAVALSPQDAEAQYNLGITLQELGKLEDAIASYRQAIALKPDYVKAHNNLGGMLKELGRLEEAKTSYTQAILLKTDDDKAHYNLGNTLKELGKLDEAEASYRQAITFKPDFVEAHANLGSLLADLGRLKESEACLTQAITLKPDYASAHYNLGNTLQELGRLDEAEASYRQAIALKPDYAQAHYNLGLTHQEFGRLEESVSSFQQAFANRSGIRHMGDDVLAPATTALFFELTNKCNFHCDFCPSDFQKRDIGSMDLELVKRLYEEAADKKIASTVNLHLMGEPTLHPKLIEVLNFAASKNVKTDLVTNCSTLVDKVVPRILDSLYGTITASHMTPTEDTYHFRGKVGLSWDRYINNLRLLVSEYMKRLAKGDEIKNNITIRVMATQNTASNVSILDTEKEARAILKEWNEFVAEVEHELGMAPFRRKDHNADDLLRGNSHKTTSYPLQQGIKLVFWRAFTFANTRVSDDFDLKAVRQTTYCPHPFTDVGVLWNGDVTLCCLDHDGQLSVGNIRDSSIEALIQNDAAEKLRASMLGQHPLPSVCETCQEKPVKREDDNQIIARS